MKAAKAGGLDEKEVKEYLDSGEDKMTIKNQIRRTNGEIDGVPYIVICGAFPFPLSTDLEGGNAISPSKVQSRRKNISRHSFRLIRNSIEMYTAKITYIHK